ncbi:type VI secretion system membrane subunit TssM [Jannaschia pohangensis]|uniref:Type VI secretion system protein ImpL n=1 Tax=Jannaschia pohangensis TaxID=390807 RepID=A0A1I3UGZ4_9RHOB|nr:type VI secretion system membrane subunit TssM [Jannaschia pohangensis]SFJ82182.1 type VI secretion system protein ImpL [Jannaschia pohangensis]
MRIFGIIPIPSPRRLWKIKWLRRPIIWLGLVILCLAIWFGLPLIPWWPMSTIWLRATVIGLMLTTIFTVQFVKWRRRRKAAEALEEQLVERAPVGDGKILAERMTEALATLKQAGGATYLYDLPWYVIIGPPGAGKTTALANAGIEFPGSKPDAVEGFGGTRNCDWWFAEEAVLIDTAGRYTTQDSGAEADAASWTAFLDLLKKGRPNQPINGVILSFSVEDMMNASETEIAAHAATVRARLAEIHDRLKIDFPVYVLFTKADLIAGFREYFASFSASRRRSVWGATFQTRDRNAETWSEVGAHFDELVTRLSDETIDRMSEEPDGVSRIAIFGLPGQMALMRENVTDFLRRVFEPTRYKTNAILRGFYFTSGTQEGTPIDQVLGAMSRGEGGDARAFQPSFFSGQGKSYFLHDLLTKVIFAERDWVSHDAKAVRRAAILRGLGLGLTGAVTAAAMVALGVSFWRNATLVNQVEADAVSYFGVAQPRLQEAVVTDPDPNPIIGPLNRLRDVTAGYADPREQELWEGIGLGQRTRLNAATKQAYSDGLERMLRPRAILQAETDLEAAILARDVPRIYRLLKVYLLLGGKQEGASDDVAIQSYLGEVWRQTFSDIGQIDEREALEGHLAAMLELDDDRQISIGIDSELVAEAREDITDLPLAEQAYAAIRDRAINAGLLDFDLSDRLGPATARVFEVADGDIETVEIQGLYTFEGYWGFFLEELTNARQRLEDDKWVLGSAAERVDYDGQLAGLEGQLHQLYRRDFVQVWNDMLDSLTLAPMALDAPGFDALGSAASTTSSPILMLAQAVEEQTRLTRIYEIIDALDPAEIAANGGSLGDSMGDAAFRRIYQQSGLFSRVVLDSLGNRGKSQEQVGSSGSAVAEDAQRIQVERIAAAFEQWHALARGERNSRPLDAILSIIDELRNNRRLALTAPSATDEQVLQTVLTRLTGSNGSLPPQLAGWLNEMDREFRAVAQDATMSDLNRALNEEVTQFCAQFVAPLYPFGNGRHISSGVFGEFFGSGGRMDRFYGQWLAPHVTRTASGIVPVPGSPVGERLNAQTLRQFDRAEAIRAAFFSGNSSEPQVSMFFTHVSSSPSVELALINVNGASGRTGPGDQPVKLDWPGEGAGVVIELYPQEPGRASDKKFGDGRWAIIDFLRQGQTRVNGNVAEVTHQIGGRTITYKVEVDSTTVPFLMPELADFQCPTSLE